MSEPGGPSPAPALGRGLRAVLFDLDGTLIAVDRQAAAARSGLLRRAVKRAWLWAETPVNYLLAWSERLGVDTDVVFQADRFRRLRGIGTSRQSRLAPGAAELLLSLRGRYRLAVVTSRARRAAAGLLAAHGLADLFEVVTTRQDTWLLKPTGSPVRRTARLLGVAPEACLMVGDTAWDIRAGRSAGARTVGVLSGLGSEAQLRRARADLVLRDVSELGAWL
ncbi:MAG: HAD family hydrolase [Chloroflexi bacterium]|nr:HAD family hydrolase [Chloroflexota bacterium]